LKRRLLIMEQQGHLQAVEFHRNEERQSRKLPCL
jgi:hypothetical protein